MTSLQYKFEYEYEIKEGEHSNLKHSIKIASFRYIFRNFLQSDFSFDASPISNLADKSIIQSKQSNNTALLKNVPISSASILVLFINLLMDVG